MRRSILSLTLFCLAIGTTMSDDDYSALRMEEQYKGLYVYEYHYLVEKDHPLMILVGPDAKLYKFQYTKEYLEIMALEQAEQIAEEASGIVQTDLLSPTDFYHSDWVCQSPIAKCAEGTDLDWTPPRNFYSLDLGGKIRWKMARVHVAYGSSTWDWIDKNDWLDEKFHWDDGYLDDGDQSGEYEMLQAAKFTGDAGNGNGYFDQQIPLDAYHAIGEYRFLDFRFYADPNFKPSYLIATNWIYGIYYDPYAYIGLE